MSSLVGFTITGIYMKEQNMYVIEIKDEKGTVVDRVEMRGWTMTSIEREITEALYNLIEGYNFTVTLEA